MLHKVFHFARDYGGLLDNESFGGVLVSRHFMQGQTVGNFVGAYSMNRQIAEKIKMCNRHEMLDVVL